ncbi:Aluminum-activated malate transporter 12 [Forsythia ovata]|uniref:Aluminum-activated malate transporter 12 n=1 Tax=Forsythia ovata TaxID=205694 RepID=A0ABD1VE60_9LAMI
MMKGKGFSFPSLLSFLKENKCKYDRRKIIHSIKVGFSLVLVSLLYLLDPLFKQVGENAMWAIMTVVVVFEFFAGATLSKGINRGIGTVIGGGLGCLAAILADKIGGIGNAIVVGSSVFIFGAAATYARLVPKIKRRYDYGALIFILTFNLVVVSGVRAEKVMDLARERLSTIGMGFGVCIFISLLIFPMWASDELHYSTASKFDKLAYSIEGCLEEYFKMTSEKENKTSANVEPCKSVLHSKSNDESLANFAKWEPWHGKFGLAYPWEKYIEIGEILREVAATIIALKGCAQSPKQPSPMQRQEMYEPCEILGLSLVWVLRELGESIEKMIKCRAKILIIPKLQFIKLQLNLMQPSSKIQVENHNNLAISSFIFLLMEFVEKVEILAKKVEELGEFANFETKKLDV